MNIDGLISMVKNGDMLGISLSIHAKCKILQENIDPLLMLAISYGDMDIMNTLFEQGANVNSQAQIKSYGHAPVLYAAANDNKEEIVAFLLGKGLDLNLGYMEGDTSLHHLIRDDYEPETWDVVLPYNPDLECKNTAGVTPLHLAASKQKWQVAELLIKAGADVNSQNNIGNTILHTTLLEYSDAVRAEDIKVLLDFGVDKSIRNNSGFSAFDVALMHHTKDTVIDLLKDVK